jgi:hypothetical protein
MAATTINLFLLQDLEDVSTRGELAESDRAALRAVARLDHDLAPGRSVPSCLDHWNATGSVALIRRSHCLIGGVALRRLEAGCKLVEGEAYTLDKGLIRDDVVVAAQVLHKRVAWHDDPC